MTKRTRLAVLVCGILLMVITATAFDGRRGLVLVQRRLRGADSAASLVADASTRQSSTDRHVGRLQARLKQRPDDVRALIQLGGAYLQKARETGDPAYYGRAEASLHRALELQPDDGDGLNHMAVLALARHQFRQALALREQARTLNPDRAFTYGVLGDAYPVTLRHRRDGVIRRNQRQGYHKE